MERAVVNKHDIKPENIKETFAYLIDLKFFYTYIWQEAS